MLTLLAAFTIATSPTDSASAILARARHVLGMDANGGSLIRITSRDVTAHGYESDRMYRPYLTYVDDHVIYLDPATGVERDSLIGAFGQQSVALDDDHAVWREHYASWAATESARALDPRLVVHAWSAAPGVTVTGRVMYRDHERVVLTRNGVYGVEHLYVDPKTGFVVKLDRIEPHYLWGQIHVEYVYMTWYVYGTDVLMPTTVTRLVDGGEEVTRTLMDIARVPRDSSPPVVMPATGTVSEVVTPGFLRPAPVDTIRVGPQTFVLANPGYNEVVSLLHDTVYVLDATQSETRARTDSTWIGRLFPGRHPVTLVVTDLAYPHVAGLRFWVASGATVISRDMSRAFLESVVARRWQLHPDKLESLPTRPALRFRSVHQSLVGPGLGLYAIDGIGSEGALMVYLPGDSLLWASDYVQQLQGPALYTSEVYAATCRYGLAPRRVVAQHQPLADWSTLQAIVQRLRIGDYPVACHD